ncbi:MAG: ATP-dependent helicase, RecQ family [Propionibacteriaceae bacterium]|jgi:ATP-dependent DNA helicase RecQ|nr:ATP-dependent helicase, RecQ family [Propionibacteriaceae bacterium]
MPAAGRGKSAVMPSPSVPGRIQPAQLLALARDRFGWSALRPEQERAVRALLDGSDVLAVMPTGWGKSAIYQLAGLFLDGPTVVLSPLLALQRDQMLSLEGTDGPGAVAVNSDARAAEVRGSWESVRSGSAEFLFLTPEQLARPEVLDSLTGARPSLLVVDEAHCVSSWGHDFRPDYLRIGDALERIGRPRVLALTATAAPPVRAEILERLRMRDASEIIHGFDRPNLTLSVRLFADDRSKQAAVVEEVSSEVKPGLVYVGRRKDTETYADRLRGSGLRAAAYHAGMRVRERERVHDEFLNGGLDVVVATSAFGMGIDKPDVRFVLHADISDSLDAYYQEIGRAGRDGEPANALLLYRMQDLGLRRFFASGRFDEEVVRRVATATRKQPATIKQLEEKLALTHRRVVNAVSLLEKAGAVVVNDDHAVSWTEEVRGVQTAVRAAERLADAVVKVNRSRVEMMRGYAETTGCRRQFLLGYFGEQLAQSCGNCDRCEEGVAPAEQHSLVESDGDSEPYPMNAHVTHRAWGPGVVMHREPDRVTVLFDDVGYKTLALELLRESDALLTVDGET